MSAFAPPVAMVFVRLAKPNAYHALLREEADLDLSLSRVILVFFNIEPFGLIARDITRRH
jgi:hypothetical protein